MEIQSPIGRFVDVLKQVKSTAVQHESKLHKNEAATRAALIDPLLRALGWDATNPDMVEFEKAYSDTRVDYALMDCFGKVRIIVEAKALGGNLSDIKFISKIFSYAFVYGIHEVILTDGIVWQHFAQSEPGNVMPETINLLSDPLTSCADYFIKNLDAFRYWADNELPETPSLPAPEKPAIILPAVAATPAPDGHKPEYKAENFVPLDSLKSNLHGEPPPKVLRLPDGSTAPIKYWRDILSSCVEFVLRENHNLPIPLPDRAGKKIFLIQTEKSDKKVAILQTIYNGKNVFIHLNYDTNNCVANALYILNFLPKGKTWLPTAVTYK